MLFKKGNINGVERNTEIELYQVLDPAIMADKEAVVILVLADQNLLEALIPEQTHAV